MTDLLKLAERCERAEEPKRGLFIEAWLATLGAHFSHLSADEIRKLPGFRRFNRMLDADAYESAALMLVPDGWGWNVSWPNIKARESGLLLVDAPCQGEAQFGYDRRFIVAAATPALAICAAALRARSASDE